jgi:hypothetical protein
MVTDSGASLPLLSPSVSVLEVLFEGEDVSSGVSPGVVISHRSASATHSKVSMTVP